MWLGGFCILFPLPSSLPPTYLILVSSLYLHSYSRLHTERLLEILFSFNEDHLYHLNQNLLDFFKISSHLF